MRRDHAGDRVGLVGLQFAPEEQLEDRAAVFAQPSVLLCKKAADQRRRGVEDLQRAADHEPAAHVGPAPRVHVGVLDLVFGIDGCARPCP